MALSVLPWPTFLTRECPNCEVSEGEEGCGGSDQPSAEALEARFRQIGGARHPPTYYPACLNKSQVHSVYGKVRSHGGPQFGERCSGTPFDGAAVAGQSSSVNSELGDEQALAAHPMGLEPDTELLLKAERELGLIVPLDWPDDAINDCVDRIGRSEEFAIRFLAFVLSACSPIEVVRLGEIFDAPGSKWEVLLDIEPPRLTLRQGGPIFQVIEGVASLSGPAYGHLAKAWDKLTASGDPEPGAVYLEAVKAVEAAMRPVVTPTDPVATLGKMINAMEAKESKWAVILPSESVADVIRRAEILRATPHERHGSDKPVPPVTPEQAQAGFDLALGLVDYFSRGLIYRVGEA